MIGKPTDPTSAQGRKSRILLVDDERLVLATLARGLERQGYEVVAVESKAGAVEAFAAQPTDVAVLDVRLAEGTGLELARELAGQYPVPVIFLSAFDDRDYVERAVAEGGYAYLVKPVTAAQIAPVIEMVLARGREFAAMRQSEDHLRSALERERQVSMAVGLVMERARLGSREAFDLLRSRARAERRRVVDVAGDIIRSVEMLNDLTAAPPEPTRPPRAGNVK
jgi:response regulator NasT